MTEKKPNVFTICLEDESELKEAFVRIKKIYDWKYPQIARHLLKISLNHLEELPHMDNNNGK